MREETAIRVVDGVDEAGNARAWDRWAALHAEDVVVASPELPAPLQGREGHLRQTRNLLDAFPDARLERRQLFGRGEWLCAEYTVTGTHRGPMALPGDAVLEATGRPLHLEYCTVYRITAGLIREERNYFDLLSLLQQLGVVP